MLLEISGITAMPRVIPTQAPGRGFDAIDCEIGEKMRRRYMDDMSR